MRKCKWFNRCLVLFLAQLAVVLLTLPNQAISQPNKPVISLPESKFTFGEVTEGAKVEHSFKVQNKGTGELLIQRVVAGCGCTAVTAINSPIAPGQESAVTVTLDTAGLSGAQSKSVRLYSNDADNPITELELVGQVQQRVAIEPKNVVFKDVVRGQKSPLTQEISIKSREPGIKLGKIESFSKYIKVSAVSGDEQSKKFTVSLDSDIPLGDFRERIIVGLSGEGRSQISIPVYAEVKGNLRTVPPAVSFGIISGEVPIVRRIKVENSSEVPYTLEKVESTDSAVAAKIIPEKPGKSYTVEVSVDPKKVKSDLRAELRFTAETELEETLSMSVYGVMPPVL